MLFKQAIWTLICTKSINMALLTCATKTHVPGLHMKFVKNLEVEESLQVNRFPSCIWKESYQVILLNDLYLKPNRVFCLCHSLRKLLQGLSLLMAHKLCLLSDQGRKSMLVIPPFLYWLSGCRWCVHQNMQIASLSFTWKSSVSIRSQQTFIFTDRRTMVVSRH